MGRRREGGAGWQSAQRGAPVEQGCRRHPKAEHGVLRYVAEELVGPKDGVESGAEKATEHGEAKHPDEGQASLLWTETVFEEDGTEKTKRSVANMSRE